MLSNLAPSTKKFERWSSRLPATTFHLIQMVQHKLVPLILERGFISVENYGSGGGSQQVGANVLPFQKRSGDMWPTMEIAFCSTGRPWFSLRFGWVADGFLRYDGSRLTKQQATLTDAPVYFALAKDIGTVSSLYMQYGYNWWALLPHKKLVSELKKAKYALPAALDMLEEGMPNETPAREEGYITKCIYRRINPLSRKH